MGANEAVYSVQAAAALAGVPPGTLRVWEQRYDAVKAARTQAGHRRYGPVAVERLKALAALVRQGHAISAVAGLTDAGLRKLLETTRMPARAPAGGAAQTRVDALRESVLRFDFARAANQLKWLRTVLGARAFVFDVVVPLFATVSALVAASELDISQEHALSAVLRDQLGDLLHTLRGLSDAAAGIPPIVFASPEDDRHEFGILLGAILAGARALPVWYAGADLPAANLANAVKAVRARHVVLGNAPVPAAERRVSFEDYLRAVDAALPDDVAVRVGGGGDRPFTSAPSGRRIHYLNSLEELDAAFGSME